MKKNIEHDRQKWYIYYIYISAAISAALRDAIKHTGPYDLSENRTQVEHFVKSGGNTNKIPEKEKMKIRDLCNIYSKIQCVKSHVVQNYFLFFLLISCSFFIAFSFLLRCSSETFFLRMYLLVEVPILLSFHFFI